MSKNRRKCPGCGGLQWLGLSKWYCYNKCNAVPDYIEPEKTEPMFSRKRKKLKLRRLPKLPPIPALPDDDDDDLDWGDIQLYPTCDGTD